MGRWGNATGLAKRGPYYSCKAKDNKNFFYQQLKLSTTLFATKKTTIQFFWDIQGIFWHLWCKYPV